jgi:hypothetical protein
LSQKDRESASDFLDDWIVHDKSAGIKMLDNFADTLENHRAGILAYTMIILIDRSLW